MNNRICPICKDYIMGYSALSRQDNKTLICSQCGVIEALQEFIKYHSKERRPNERVEE